MAAKGLSKCFRHLTASKRLCLKRMIWRRCLATNVDDAPERCDVVISGGGMVGTAMACALGGISLSVNFDSDLILGNAVTSQHGALLSDDIKALKTNR